MTTSATKTTVTAKIPGLTGGDYTLLVKRSVMELNEARTPYGRIELTVALPGSSVLDQISPYVALRIQGTITHEWVTPVRASQTRSFDFLLHERTIDHGAATLTLVGQTDEAMLIDRLNTSSTLARSYGLSVKTAVEYALTQIGASLEAGAIDATLTSKTLEATITNRATNPSWETATTNYRTPASATLTRVTTGHSIPGQSNAGSAFGRLTFTGTIGTTGHVYSNTTSGDTTTAGAVESAQWWVRSSKTQRVAASIQWLNGTTGNGAITGPEVVLSANTWTLVTVTGTAPASSTGWGPYVFSVAGTGYSSWVSGDTFDADCLLMVDGSLPTGGYFDGATPDTGLYDYSWTGTANASTSTKVNLGNTDATIWQRGQSLDRWLAPILEASNRRLFCDEHRKWRLVDGSYGIEGSLSISEKFNAKRASDTMSRQKAEQGVPTWFDHVVVHYQWKDAAGVTQEMWDAASSGSVKGYLVEVTTPWPGPGAAAGILSRATGRGRTQDITALTDYLATPGMAIVTTLPGTPIQSGILSSVTWRWDNTADDMTVGSRGLTDTPSNAWIFAAGAWSAATGSWAAATGTN